MQNMHTFPLSLTFNDEHFISLIKERESTVEKCKLLNTKKRRTTTKKKKSLKEMIMSLEGEELDAFLEEQGFTLNKM